MSLSYIEIDAAALRWNLAQLRTLTSAKVAVVAKGNAYGHGLREVVSVLDSCDGVNAFQVDDIEELRALRQVTQARALVFGYVPKEELEEAVSLGGELVIYDFERIEVLDQIASTTGVKPRVHLKIDALLGRQGILPAEAEAYARRLAEGRLDVVSVYGHFANIEDTEDLTHAHVQIRALKEALAVVQRYFPSVECHASASSGLMTVETELSSAWVRLGIAVYGLYPSPGLAKRFAHLQLRPVMRWVSHLAQVKVLPAGHPVGYGLSYVTPREMPVGIVPQGYSDGYDRGLSNCGEVLVHGQRCPVIGRVAMNMFAIDLTAVPSAKAEDEVVLLGLQGEEVISPEAMATKLGTINYEAVTRVSPLLPRVLH